MEYIESSNKVLARYYDAFIKRTSGIIQETAEDIGTGAARMSVWISPNAMLSVDPKYSKLISEFRHLVIQEDKRMMVCILSLIANPNLIYDMVKTIVDYLFSKMPEKTQKNLSERYRELGSKVSSVIAEQAIKQTTKIAIIEGLSKLIATKISNEPITKLTADQMSKGVITAFQIYSYVEKAAQSARKLRRDDRVIYNMLYSKNTEMFYFIVAKKIDPLIVVTKLNDHTNADELINVLADIFYDW
ncbi:hypothetical protein [Pectobacterium versatile]|uniref:hypothetical protein n=1 Tax=Pectobacterium versatile TaxID=2488639 RepID=UPI0032EEF2B6